jgi:RNA polymerase sigma-70 factor (ECF subfamily)
MHGLSAEIADPGPVGAVGAMPTRIREPEPFRASEDPDAELVARWQAGDASAFERLVRAHERNVFRLLYRMLGSREEAEDAAQEAFLSLHRHGHRFRREARFSTFLYRVAANAALNRRRSRSRARAREIELAQRHATGAHVHVAPRDPEDATHGAEIQHRVQEALQHLPDELRVAVVLYDIEGQSYKDIAETLSIPEGTVKSRIHRARLGLRERLKELVQSSSTGEKP